MWNTDGKRQAAKWKGRIRSPAALMENREMILQTDTRSWFVNLSELFRQDDMNGNIPQKKTGRVQHKLVLTMGRKKKPHFIQ